MFSQRNLDLLTTRLGNSYAAQLRTIARRLERQQPALTAIKRPAEISDLGGLETRAFARAETTTQWNAGPA